jgi:hypothetical protein
MTSFKHLYRLLLIALTAASLSGCVKKDYDEPDTANVDPNLTANLTIAQLRALAVGTAPIEITNDYIIAGVVVADDESGTFYKQMIIQDSTAGIAINLDISNYNSDYPIGRRIFVKLKGLYVANDGDDNYEIGVKDNSSIGRIPSALVSQYLVKGKWGVAVTPVSVSLSTLTTNGRGYTQRLIRLPEVEFTSADAGVAYGGDPNSTFDNNRTVEDCSTPTNSAILYTSSFANFANALTPTGKGPMEAIFTIYNGNAELILRTTDDVAGMTGNRCDGSSGTLTEISIDSVRLAFTGTTTTAPAGRKIRGIVTSDYTNSNLTANNLTIQDATGAIVVRFGSAHSFTLGTEIEVNISGQELSEFNGWLQVNNVPLGNAVAVGTGTVTPRTATIAQILSNYNAWESQVVKITGVTISGTGTYSGSQTLSDGTGTITMFTRSSASFATQSYPTGTVSVTGILSEYSPSSFTPQIIIRNTSDVQ